MAENLDPAHKPHEQSLAFVAGQGKVSGFEFGQQQADYNHGRDESMLRLEESQMVSGQKDGFEPKEEEAIALGSGPAKTVIPVPEQQSSIPLGGPSASANASAAPAEDMFSGAGGDSTTIESAPAETGASYDDPFGGGDDDPFGGGDAIALGPSTTTQISVADSGAATTSNAGGDDIFGGMSYGDEEKQDELPEETFLSVWKAKRAKKLEERAQAERASKEESEENGKAEIAEFYKKRNARIEASRQQIKDAQDNIRAELNSVFETGTIWEQVARLCDLNKTDNQIERMRTLLIELKNS